MNRLNESVISTLPEENEVGVAGVADPTYASAMNDRAKLRKELPKRFKDQEKATGDFVKSNHKTELTPKGTPQMKKMKLSESMFEAVEAPERPTDIYYQCKRQPLADIIQSELTLGETVYKLDAKGNYVPTTAPSLNLSEEDDIGVSSDSRGDYIIAYVPTEADCAKVESIARRYNRVYQSGYSKYNIGNKYFTKIYLNDEDWDTPYVDNNVQIRPNGRSLRWHRDKAV